jgi:hypothetical protein
MHLIDYIKKEIFSSSLFEKDMDFYKREQIYARILSYANNPNRYFSDLDILHDELYNLRCFVFDIMQDKVKIHIILIGHFDENFTHFCDIIVNNNDKIISTEYDGKILWDEIKSICDKYIDYDKNFNVCGFRYTNPKLNNIKLLIRY